MTDTTYKKEDTGLKSTKTLENCKILYVEDNEVNQFLAQQILKPWNAHIEFAENGEAAIKRLKEKEFDVVLMDIQMPVMDGIEATRAIRQDRDIKKDIPIIGFTADIMMGTKIAAMKAGMDHVVIKPFDKEVLFDIITDVLDKRINSQ